MDQIFTLKRMCRKNHRAHVFFKEVKNLYDRINREALWQVLSMLHRDDKVLNVIKNVYVNTLDCMEAKGRCE